MADQAELARRFGAAAAQHRSRAPFHARLCEVIAGEPDVAGLLGAAPPEQQLPVLLLAAIHDQVLADPDGELASWYPSTVAHPRDDDVGRALLDHCRRHADELRRTVATRTTQTNEVGRCGLLLPAFGLLAAEVGVLAWVEVGASAGLNLHLDRFGYEYRPGGRLPGDSSVHITVGTRGSVPVPTAMPETSRRVGIDQDPLRAEDERAIRWLRACIWPDQLDRLRRLDEAVDLVRSDPVDLRRGDAVDDLPALVAELRPHGHPVVTTSWVLNYLSDHRRTEFVRRLDQLAEDGDLSWVFAEAPRQAPGLPYEPSVAELWTTVVGVVRWRDGERHVRHLGVAHPHGFWLHWDDRAPTGPERHW